LKGRDPNAGIEYADHALSFLREYCSLRISSTIASTSSSV
jgi:hypothetical protein